MHGFAAHLVAAGTLTEIAFPPRVNIDSDSELRGVLRDYIKGAMAPAEWAKREKRDSTLSSLSTDIVNLEGLAASRRLPVASDPNETGMICFSPGVAAALIPPPRPAI